MTTQPARLVHAPSSTRATPAQNLITIVLGWWLMIGIFVDGWAHQHLAGEIESFFTPWHAIFYSGFTATALWVLWLAWQGWRAGRRGLAAFPAGYHLAALGVPVFALGGVGDLTWHTVFGIEVDLDALLSPTHLILFLGAELLVLAPLAAAWAEPEGRRAPLAVRWTAVLAATAALSFASFMHMYLWALLLVPNGTSDNRAALAFTLVTAVILAAPPLYLLRRFQMPPGALAVMYAVNTLLMVVMTVGLAQGGPLVLLMAGIGLVLDLIAWVLRPSPQRIYAFRAFGALLGLVTWFGFYVAVLLTQGLSMSLELWAGVCVMTGLGGLALSALIVPPALPREAVE